MKPAFRVAAGAMLVAGAAGCATSTGAAPAAHAGEPAKTSPPPGGRPAGDPSFARVVAPNVGRKLLLVDPQQPPYRPVMPPGVDEPTFAIVKICASETGAVTKASVVNQMAQPAQFANAMAPALSNEVVAEVMTWRFAPFVIHGVRVPSAS